MDAAAGGADLYAGSIASPNRSSRKLPGVRGLPSFRMSDDRAWSSAIVRKRISHVTICAGTSKRRSLQLHQNKKPTATTTPPTAADTVIARTSVSTQKSRAPLDFLLSGEELMFPGKPVAGANRLQVSDADARQCNSCRMGSAVARRRDIKKSQRRDAA